MDTEQVTPAEIQNGDEVQNKEGTRWMIVARVDTSFTAQAAQDDAGNWLDLTVYWFHDADGNRFSGVDDRHLVTRKVRPGK